MNSEQWFLRDLSEEPGLIQQVVPASSGLTQTRISQLERGTGHPIRKERTAIADAPLKRAAVRGPEILILARK